MSSIYFSEYDIPTVTHDISIFKMPLGDFIGIIDDDPNHKMIFKKWFSDLNKEYDVWSRPFNISNGELGTAICIHEGGNDCIEYVIKLSLNEAYCLYDKKSFGVFDSVGHLLYVSTYPAITGLKSCITLRSYYDLFTKLVKKTSYNVIEEIDKTDGVRK